MSRFLQIFNFLGIAALAVLCSTQWRTNRTLNLDIIDREKMRLQQVAKIEEQSKAIKGYTADLDDFRQRLTLSETALKESQEKFRDLAADRDKLIVERDQLKTSLDKYIAAVAERGAALKRASEQIQMLSADRNDAVAKFNDLAAQYNALVDELKKAGKKQ
jgi:chromosome segregation ATPase